LSITPDHVRAIAHLARLGVAEDRLSEYAGELNTVLGLVEQMNDVDTDGVEPMAHPFHASQRLREDTVSEENQREVLQRGAPAVEAGLFQVPKVID